MLDQEALSQAIVELILPFVEAAREQERHRVREAFLLLAITHFDHERLLTDENLDATDLFEGGLLEHREIGQTGEYEACLPAKGFETIKAALDSIFEEADDG